MAPLIAPELLRRVWRELGGHPGALEQLQTLHPTILPSRTDVATLATSSVAAVSVAAAHLAGAAPVVLDGDAIASAYGSERSFQIDGSAPAAFAPLSAFFPTVDGWVRTHANYPHHALALRRGLELAPDADAATVAGVLRRSTEHVVARIVAAGGVAARVAEEDVSSDERDRAERIIGVTRLGPAPRADTQAAVSPDAPLRGIRVLDLTRVIAGPVCTRTLALLGAEVLRIDPPSIAEIEWQHLDTGHGKRSAQLDIRTDRSLFDDLLARADVIVTGYRPGGMARLGLAPGQLAARRPGIVVALLSAWGSHEAERRGFDSIVQAASGIALVESGDATAPGRLPVQALDHSAGYLLAAAVIMLLGRRADEGGSWLADTSLRRIAAELLGMPRTIGAPPAVSDLPAPTQEFDVDGHRVTTAAPAFRLQDGLARYAPPRPWGRDLPRWTSRDDHRRV